MPCSGPNYGNQEQEEGGVSLVNVHAPTAGLGAGIAITVVMFLLLSALVLACCCRRQLVAALLSGFNLVHSAARPHFDQFYSAYAPSAYAPPPPQPPPMEEPPLSRIPAVRYGPSIRRYEDHDVDRDRFREITPLPSFTPPRHHRRPDDERVERVVHSTQVRQIPIRPNGILAAARDACDRTTRRRSSSAMERE